MVVALQNSTELVRRLGDEDPDVRDAAMQKLIDLGEAALPALREAPDDPEVRARAARVIERIEWPAMKALEAELKRLNESGMRKYELVETSNAEFRRAFPDIRVFRLPVTWQAPELSSIDLGPTYFVWRMESELVAAEEITKKRTIVIRDSTQATLLARALHGDREIPELEARSGGYVAAWKTRANAVTLLMDVDKNGKLTGISMWGKERDD